MPQAPQEGFEEPQIFFLIHLGNLCGVVGGTTASQGDKEEGSLGGHPLVFVLFSFCTCGSGKVCGIYTTDEATLVEALVPQAKGGLGRVGWSLIGYEPWVQDTGNHGPRFCRSQYLSCEE